MSIPLDNLYFWIAGHCPQPANIYYFWPHGAKKFSNIVYFAFEKEFEQHRLNYNVFCFDQEPLDFDFYEKYSVEEYIQEANNTGPKQARYNYLKQYPPTNLNLFVDDLTCPVYDKTILIHSERNGYDLEQYQQAGYIPVHYWCHGVVSRDWYRFAEIDPRLKQPKHVTHDFLVYCRDWSGSREYRLKLLELLQKTKTDLKCKIYFNQQNNQGTLYKNFVANNQNLQLESSTELVYPQSKADSSASADYDVVDHLSTHVSVVLETNFDGDRIQLTEKVCRAIVCEHPFILAAGPGSLQYLRDYGFETFDPWIDESYDLEKDSLKRLQMIADTMHKFSNQPPAQKQKALDSLSQIAQRNKQRFFSKDFFEKLEQELVHGLKKAFVESSKHAGQRMLSRRRAWKKSSKTKLNKFRRSDFEALSRIRQIRLSHNSFFNKS